MKKIILILLLLVPFLVNSQSSCIKAKLGAGIPLGKFGVVDDEKAANAKIGINLDLSAEHKFSDYFGVKGSFSFNFNPRDKDKLMDFYRELKPYMTWQDDIGGYTVSSFLVGLVGTIPTDNILSIDFYGMVGYSFINDQGSIINGSDWITLAYYNTETEAANAGGLGYMIGTDLLFEVSERISLLFGINYFGTRAEFKDVKWSMEDSDMGNIPLTADIDYEYDISILNADVGVKVLLGKIKKKRRRGSRRR